MTDTPNENTKYNPTQDLVYFAYVVDGEVGHMHGIPRFIERAVAALASNPQVVQVPDDLVGDLNHSFAGGRFWSYENGKFIAPEGFVE